MLTDVIRDDAGTMHAVRRDVWCDCHPADPSAAFTTACGEPDIYTGHAANRTHRDYRMSVDVASVECRSCRDVFRHCGTCTCAGH